MKIEVRRDLYTNQSTQGELFLDDVHECYTLEPAWKTDGSKPRAINNGTFPLTIRWSYDHNRHLPHVENVPDFTAIEQHIGNKPPDTKGCTLVGQTRGPQPDWIGMSTPAHAQLMNKYFAVAVLRNPEEKDDKLHVWDVGVVTYMDVREQT